MDKKVILSITGNQGGIPGLDGTIELITEARLYKKGDTYYIEYEESELSGSKGTRTIITVDGDRVFLERQGAHQSQFVFEKGTKFINYYNTPFGNLEMGVYPVKVDFFFNENEGKLDLKYQLDIGGKFAGSNELQVSYWDYDQKSAHRQAWQQG